MDALPIRLKPGDDLRRALEAAIAGSGCAEHVGGGRVGHGCIVRTAAEVLVALLDAWDLDREHETATEYDELAIRRRAAARGTPT